MTNQIQNSVFAVLDEPFCAWGWDLAERNLLFLDGLDEGYFEYVARTHQEHLDGVDGQRAAIALRANYHLCLETFFGLVGAALQAPSCVAGWVLKVRTEQLRAFTKALADGTVPFPMAWKIDHQFDFLTVAKLIFRYSSWQKEDDKTVERFATMWHRLAGDFLDGEAIAEYNSIKHGFRARSGGFAMRFGVEHDYGVPPPEEEMGAWEGSEFGTSFFSADAIGSAGRRSPHFTLRRHGLNWLPENTAGRMLLAAMSIKNLRSFLVIENGRQPGTTQFCRPVDEEDYDRPWRRSPGVTSSSMDLIVETADILDLSREELRAKLP